MRLQKISRTGKTLLTVSGLILLAMAITRCYYPGSNVSVSPPVGTLSAYPNTRIYKTDTMKLGYCDSAFWTVTNNTNDVVITAGAKFTSSSFYLEGYTMALDTLQPGDYMNLDLWFCPQVAGPVTDTLLILGQDAKTVLITIPLHGYGTN